MKKAAKFLSILLSAGMACGLVTGCGTADTANESSGQSTQAVEETASLAADSAEAGDVLEVELWTSDLAKEALMTGLIEDYNATIGQEEGIRLSLTSSADVATMLQLGLENGELPLLTDNWNWVSQEDGGWLIPFAQLPGGQEFVDSWEQKVGQETFDTFQVLNKAEGSDDVYMLPHTEWGCALFYNEDMFVEAGIVDENGEAKPPTTWNEFLECCEILTTDTTYGVALPMQFTWFVESVMRTAWNSQENYPVYVNWDDLTVEFNCEVPFEALAQIYQNGYCVPGAETIDADPARSYFSEGVAAMIFGSSGDIGVFESQYVADFNWNVCQLAAEDGSSYGAMLGSGNFYAPTIAALDLSQADQEKLMSVIEWLYGDEVGVAIMEAGINIPINPEVWEKADMSALSPQVAAFVEQLDGGRVDVKIEALYQNVDYGNYQGVGLLNDSLVQLCKGEISYEDYKALIEEKFTEALKAKVEDGTINPEDYQ